MPKKITVGSSKHFNPFKGSPGSHSQSVSWSVGITSSWSVGITSKSSWSVGITSSCSLWVFPLSVSLTSASVSWYLDFVTVLAYSSNSYTGTQSSHQVEESKITRRNVHNIINAHVISADAQTNQPTNQETD